MSTSPVNPTIRCAIYTRTATIPVENSLDAQRDAGEAYIRSRRQGGWVLVQDRYDDEGCSASNMERPALLQLLEDVKSGKVQMVVVNKIDRLSRSHTDFAQLVRILEEHGAGLTTVTEQFSTATTIGRLHHYILLTSSGLEQSNEAGEG